MKIIIKIVINTDSSIFNVNPGQKISEEAVWALLGITGYLLIYDHITHFAGFNPIKDENGNKIGTISFNTKEIKS